MQDRFKFRAWNKLSNELKDIKSLNINHSFPDCSNVILETNSFDKIKTHNMPIECAAGFNNIILMQCTGKKDKTGKLIFEGDIVREYDEYGYVMIKEVVFLEDVMFGFNINVEFDYEIIGNIYENPELLEETNDKI